MGFTVKKGSEKGKRTRKQGNRKTKKTKRRGGQGNKDWRIYFCRSQYFS